jgi:histidine triad (HIT) family protein
VIPTKHAANLSELAARGDAEEIAHLFSAAARLGARLGPAGYRIVVNEGDQAGQAVDHVHVHVLAGRRMGWPPG